MIEYQREEALFGYREPRPYTIGAGERARAMATTIASRSIVSGEVAQDGAKLCPAGESRAIYGLAQDERALGGCGGTNERNGKLRLAGRISILTQI